MFLLPVEGLTLTEPWDVGAVRLHTAASVESLLASNDHQWRGLRGLAIRRLVSYAGGMRYPDGGGLDAAEQGPPGAGAAGRRGDDRGWGQRPGGRAAFPANLIKHDISQLTAPVKTRLRRMQ